MAAMASKQSRTERIASTEAPAVKVRPRRYWPWSFCPCGSGLKFRRCCGTTGAKDCRYEKE
ncbi:MAG: SEC-C metal-binding domain-containing protein [Planctomycetota bacterium]